MGKVCLPVSIVVFCSGLSIGQVNIALNKPTQMSVTNIMYGAVKEHSNDGIYFRNIPNCAYPKDKLIHRYVWWSVDLGDVYDISHVNITRRSGTQLLINIQIELTLGSPITCGASAAKVCAVIRHDVAHPSENFICDPGATGRYLTIRRFSTIEGMPLCEVEVYGTLASASGSADNENVKPCSASAKLIKQVDKGLSGDVSEGESTSKLDCSIECMTKGSCVAYSFNPVLSQCQYAAGFPVISTVNSADWETYTMPC